MKPKTIIHNYWEQITVAILAVIVFCFWLFLYPFIPVVREMSQLFLWTGDYLTARLAVPGGAAQYLGEFIAQFFLNPVNGAVAYAVLFVVAWLLSSRLLRQFFPAMRPVARFLLSLVVPAVLWYVAMLPHVPLTPTVAAILVMAAGWGLMSIASKRMRLLALCAAIPVVYWLTGPLAVLLTLCCVRWLPLTGALFAACLVGSSYLTPYPLRQVATGIDYDWSGVKEMGTYEEMECDMLMRQQSWEKILRRFPSPQSPAVRSAVILASYKCGQISYHQLMSTIVVPVSRYESEPSVFCVSDLHFQVYFGSVSSAFIVSELASQLSWSAISQRAAFEAMEYIPNCNKSGRALKHLAELSIITGQYPLAAKYLSILDATTFYHRWAEKMRPLLDNPQLIEREPFLRQSRDKYQETQDYFFI